MAKAAYTGGAGVYVPPKIVFPHIHPGRWNQIRRILTGPLGDFQSITTGILSYNDEFKEFWKFTGLYEYLEKILSLEEKQYHYDVLIPGIARLALDIERQMIKPMHLLPTGMPGKLTMTRQQGASILANAFFCTLIKQGKYLEYRTLRFERLFAICDKGRKLKCIFHYFSRILKEAPVGLLTFERRIFQNFPKWKDSGKLFCLKNLTTVAQANQPTVASIENSGLDILQIDFASKFIGGGVLNYGCVQEEIRFLICPELMLSILFSGIIADNETIIIKGFERFSSYSGYSHSFNWAGDYRDPAQIDPDTGILNTVLACMDARNYRGKTGAQYLQEEIDRELNKAYLTFAAAPEYNTVATGHWGCGAYQGNVELKSMIQLIAATEADKHVIYCAFNDVMTAQKLAVLHEYIGKALWTVGDLYNLLLTFSTARQVRRELKLYDFIWQKVIKKK